MDNLAFVDDIEDIIGENDVKPKERYKNKPVPVPKSRKVKKKNVINNGSIISTEKEDKQTSVTSGEEGNFRDESGARVYVKTWGCAHNR